MGLFSKLLGINKEHVVIPSMEEQQKCAELRLDHYCNLIFNDWDKHGEGECKWEIFRIAGITHHCSKSDIGKIEGFVFRDHDNKYDKNAIAIRSVDWNGNQKMLGYIGKDEQKAFNDFAGDEEMLPLEGYIKEWENDESRGICGVVKVFCGCAGKVMYDEMLKDDILLTGCFNGYCDGEWLYPHNSEGLKLEWVLDRDF